MKYPFHHRAKGVLFEYARHNRHLNTAAEGVLWQHLRGRKQLGFKFRRQHPIDRYVVDFYCHECGLILEADGFVHQENDNPEYDTERTAYLNHLGLTVLRFTNDDILFRTENVLLMIRDCLTQHITHHISSPPLRPGEGAGG